MFQRLAFLVSTLLLMSIGLRAQTWEAGLFLGGSNYKGDVAPQLESSETNGAIGLLLRYNAHPHWAFRLAYHRGSLTADERNYEPHAQRRLSFETSLDEISLVTEFHFVPYGVGIRPKRLTPYFMVGVSYMGYLPHTFIGDEEFLLVRNPTEGQGRGGPGTEEGSNQIAFPIGGGLKVSVSRRVDMVLSVSTRILTEDYIDDVSTGYPDPDALNNEVERILANPSITTNNPVPFVEGKQRGDHFENGDFVYFAGIQFVYKFSDPACYQFN
jgi:hypothetical protein